MKFCSEIFYLLLYYYKPLKFWLKYFLPFCITMTKKPTLQCQNNLMNINFDVKKC